MSGGGSVLPHRTPGLGRLVHHPRPAGFSPDISRSPC